jgi:hypothetical protein
MGKEKQPKILEKNITKDIRALLKQYNIFHYKAWQGMGSTPGVSDIIGLLPDGRFLAIEVKTPIGMHRRFKEREKGEKINQDDFLDNIKLNKGVAFYAISSLDVLQALRSLGFVK